MNSVNLLQLISPFKMPKQSLHKQRPILDVYCRHAILNWVAFSKVPWNHFFWSAERWDDLHNSCCASWHTIHNGSIEWKVLARHTDQRCEQRSWTEEDGRRDVERCGEMCADECVERRLLARQSLLISFLSMSFSHAILRYLPPLSCSTSPPHIRPISLLLPLSVFSKSHFLSHHLSPWFERLVLTVFIIPCLSSFDQEDSSQDLAAAAQNRARHIRTHRGR